MRTKILVITLLAILQSNLTWSSPVTTDQIVGPPSGGLTISNGQAIFSLPSSLLPAGEQILTQTAVQSMSGKTFNDAASNVFKQTQAVIDSSLYVGGIVPGRYSMTGLSLPNNAIIKNVTIDVTTSLVGTGTISMGCVSDNDEWNPYKPTAMTKGLYMGTGSTGGTNGAIKLSAATGCGFLVNTQPITAGRFVFLIDYAVSQ